MILLTSDRLRANRFSVVPQFYDLVCIFELPPIAHHLRLAGSNPGLGPIPLMSTSVDARRRPGLWSYISFTSSPRRRSVSLPTRNNHDTYGKDNRRRAHGWTQTSAGTVGRVKEAWMTQGQQARFLKVGGVFFLVGLLLFLLSSGENRGLGNLVKSL